MKSKEVITEKWSQKYKSSINCSNPKGFSQKAHCAGRKKHNESAESIQPGNYVYHASYLPNLAAGLKSLIKKGLQPSKTGYAGPGTYFSYDSNGGFYHVDKEEATLLRVKWLDLVKLYGVYPDNPNGIQRDDNEIIVPGPVPADLIEVEYFSGEWWDLKSALSAETYHHDLGEAVYKGNIGMMEMWRFQQVATPEEKMLMKKLIDSGDSEGAWELLKDVTETELTEAMLVTDVPNEDWLDGKIRYAKERGRNSFGVPYMGSTTAVVRSPSYVELPVSLLKHIPGARGEQSNVRKDDLEAIMKIMKRTGKLPLMDNGKEYLPFICVAWNGEPWVMEGNHRIMAAAALGWDKLPIELKYFDGGERIERGLLYPPKIGLQNPNPGDTVIMNPD